MQYLKIEFIVIVICSIFSSCQHSQKATVNEEQCVMADTGNIHQVIDSTRLTKELEKVQKLMVKYLKVENNHFVMPLTKEEFQQHGISDHYYKQMMDDIERANRCIDSLNIKDTKKMLQESYRDLYDLQTK